MDRRTLSGLSSRPGVADRTTLHLPFSPTFTWQEGWAQTVLRDAGERCPLLRLFPEAFRVHLPKPPAGPPDARPSRAWCRRTERGALRVRRGARPAPYRPVPRRVRERRQARPRVQHRRQGVHPVARLPCYRPELTPPAVLARAEEPLGPTPRSPRSDPTPPLLTPGAGGPVVRGPLSGHDDYLPTFQCVSLDVYGGGGGSGK